MQLELRHTLGELKRLSGSLATEPYEVLRVINLLSPRNWSVCISYDGSRYIWDFQCTPLATDDELRELLSGCNPAIYCADEVRVQLSESCYSVNIPHSTESQPNSSVLALVPTDHDISEYCLSLAGLAHHHSWADTERLRDWLLCNTWFGSWQSVTSTFTLSIETFTSPRQITNEPPTDAYPIKRKRYALVDDESQTVLISCREGNPRFSIRHSLWGEFRASWLERADIDKLKQQFQHGAELEIICDDLRWSYSQDPVPLDVIDSLGVRLSEAAKTLTATHEYHTFQHQAVNAIKERQAERLRTRQQNLAARPTVHWREHSLGAEPTCEMETVLLYGKLEALDALPFTCFVREYTPREGIDSLGDFRFSDAESQTTTAPIEFEFNMSSFINHQHPIQQVDLVIAWRIDRRTLPNDVTLQATEHSWLNRLTFGNCQIPVVSLEDIPELTKQLHSSGESHA
jgi:hypothetical protein